MTGSALYLYTALYSFQLCTMAKFTGKQERFIEEYLKCLHCTKAAIRAGYSAKTAYAIGSENLKKLEIRNEINRRLSELSLGPNETLQSISEIAKASLNDYLTIRKEYRVSKVKKHLSELIADLNAQIEDADKLFTRGEVPTEEAVESHYSQQAARRRKILVYEIELERNPAAFRIVDGEPELVETAELDLVRIARDRDGGRIKSVSITETGTKVEMYAADGALRDLAKIHGLFEKDNDQKKPDAPDLLRVVIVPPSEEEDE